MISESMNEFLGKRAGCGRWGVSVTILVSSRSESSSSYG